MQNAAANFYRQFYLRTNGYIPVKPLNSVLYPGDFFQIKQGEIALLGNIFRNNVIAADQAVIDYHLKLNPANWHFSDGISKPYSGRGSAHDPVAGEFEFSKQVIAFSRRGSFVFHASTPEAARIANWEDLKQSLIIKLTQTFYSFRELYVVTECATASDWSLAIACSENAEMEIAGELDHFGISDLFGQGNVKVIQSRDIEFYHKETGRKPRFFRAKKLAVKDEKKEIFLSDFVNHTVLQNEWAASFYDFEMGDNVSYTPDHPTCDPANTLDMLPAHELNPNTVLQYFKWADVTLDDVEKLFP